MKITPQPLPASMLVVDDSAQDLRLLVELLRPRGYRVRAASDGLQALATARLEPPDLILLDVVMPGLSGYEVCEQLQQDEATRAVPVIFLSAADEVLDKVRAFDAGGVDYITKPVQAEEVLARVETHLTLSRLLKESTQLNAKLQQEVAERKQAEINLVRVNQTLEQRLGEIATLNLISQTLATVTDLPEALEIVAGTTTRLLDIYGAGVMLLDDAGTEMSHFASFMRPGSTSPREPSQDRPGSIQTLDLTFPVSDDLLSRQVLQDGQTLVICQAQTNPLVAPAHQILQTYNIHGVLLVPLVVRAQVIGLIGLATDQAERDFTPQEIKLAETIAAQVAGAIKTARLLDQERQRRRLAERLHAVSLDLASTSDLATLLQDAMRHLDHLVDFQRAAIMLVEAGHDNDETLITVYAYPSQALSTQFTRPHVPLSGLPVQMKTAFEQGQTIYVENTQMDEAVQARLDDVGDKSWSAMLKAMKSWIAAPLAAGGRTVGLLNIMHGEAAHYQAYEVESVQTFANQLAVAVNNSRLNEQAQHIVALEERNRLARELHDSISQSLYSMTLHTDATLLALWSNKLEVVENHLHRLNQMAREAMAEMRLLIFEMRPPVLEEVGLAAALKVRLEAVEARSGLGIEFKVEGDQPLPPATEAELYWIALEGLNNVVKHAQADQVAVHLIIDDSSLRLTIQDDGIGFDLESATRYGGYGLVTMNERVEQIHGTMIVNTAPGAGTRLEIEVKR